MRNVYKLVRPFVYSYVRKRRYRHKFAEEFENGPNRSKDIPIMQHIPSNKVTQNIERRYRPYMRQMYRFRKL